MTLNCRTNQQAINVRKKRSWSEAERSSLRKRAQQRNKVLEALREVHGNLADDKAATIASKVEGYRHEWQMMQSEAITLNPNEADRLQSYLAKNFGVVRKALGLGDDFTLAGQVRMDLVDARRYAQGLVDDVGKYATIGKLRDLRKELIAIGKRHNIKGTELDELFVEVTEVGQTPRARLAYGNTGAVNAFLDARLDRFEKLMQAAGFNEAEIDRLVQLSMEASNISDNILAVSKATGVDIDPINNMGYFMRVMTEDAKLRLDQLFQKDGGYVKPGIGTSRHARERSTWWLIPEDYVTLSEYFTPGSVSRYQKWLREATGLEQSALDNLHKVLTKERRNDLLEAHLITETGLSKDDVKRIRSEVSKDKDLKRAHREALVNDLARDAGVVLSDYKKALRSKEAYKLHNMTPDEYKVYRRGLSRKLHDRIFDTELTKRLGMSLDTYKTIKDDIAKQITPGQILVTSDDLEFELARLIADRTKQPFTIADLYDKRAELIREAGGRTEAEWDTLFQDPVAFLNELHTNLSAEQIDALVDSGVLSKVPMTSREVLDYFVKQYELPYTKLSELYDTDIGTALQGYRESLRRAAGDSAIFKRIVDDGGKAGWVVSPLEVAGDPGKFKGFRRLDELDMTRFGTDPELAERFKGAYVHPLVYDQLDGLIGLSVSPKAMHEFAQTYHWFIRTFQTTALLSSNVAYVGRQVLSNTIQFIAGGGHLNRVIPTAIDLMKLYRSGLDALDNVHPFRMSDGKWMTKREWYRRAMMERGQDVIPMSAGHRIGDFYGTVQRGMLNPTNLPKAIQEVVSYGMMFGDPISGVKGSLGYAGRKLERLANTALAPFASAATFTDLVFKFSLAQSVMKGNGFDDAVRQAHSLISTNHSAGSIKDAFKHVDNYFIDYMNLGNTQRFFGRYVRPFAGYAMMNPPMQVRHALRNPTAFLSYMRLSSLLYGAGMRPDITEAGFSKNELDDTAAGIIYDPDSKLATVLFSANYDPIIDAFTFMKESGEKVQRVSGKFAGSGYEMREDLTQKYTVRQLMQDLIGQNTNEVWKTVSEVISGRDSFTGQEVDKSKKELFGIEMSPDVVWILSKFPLIGAADRALGGRGYVEDQFGRRVAEAQPNALGLTPNRKATRSEESEYYTEQRLSSWANNVRKLVGLRVKTIDVAEGNQATYADIMRTRRDLKKAIMEHHRKANERGKTQDPATITQMETLRAQYIQLTVDAYRVRDWAQRNKVDIDKVLEKLQQRQIDVRSLPVPSTLMEKLINEATNEMRQN